MLCVPAFAPAAAMICSCARSAVGWVRRFLSNNPVAPWSRFTVAWEHLIFGGHIIYHMSLFLFLHEKLSGGIAKAVDDLRSYERRGGRGGNCKPPPVCNGPVSTFV